MNPAEAAKALAAIGDDLGSMSQSRFAAERAAISHRLAFLARDLAAMGERADPKRMRRAFTPGATVFSKHGPVMVAARRRRGPAA